jgi:hypothetical protein
MGSEKSKFEASLGYKVRSCLKKAGVGENSLGSEKNKDVKHRRMILIQNITTATSK